MAKKLRILASYQKEGKAGQEEAIVPFVTGRHDLPKGIYPFNVNTYVGPDEGYSLSWIDIDAEQGILRFGYHESVKLDNEGKAHWSHPSRVHAIEFDFALIDE